jgi:hypothetical protein
VADAAAWQTGWDLGSSRASGKSKSKAKSGDDDSKTPTTTDGGGTGGQTYFKGSRKKAPSDSGGSSSSGGGGNPWSILPVIKSSLGFGGSKKKGGPIHRTALYVLHRGEHVIPAKHGRSRKTVVKRSVIKR